MIKTAAHALQRIVLVFILVASGYLLVATFPAFAQSPNPYTAPNMNSDVPNNMHNWTQNVMIEVMSALTCQLTGVDPVNPNQQCLGVDQKSGKIGFVPSAGSGQAGGGGAIGMMGNLIAMTYTPPLHTGDYFSYLAQNFGITKSAYAQGAGVGFEGLKPLMGLWSAFRNIVYLLFVIVFVVIGLAIMLRVKIDPRTVMTLENQIPKIIIGLILVTFSFAIAGFLIDLMWVLIYLMFNVISSASPSVANLNPTAMQGKSALEAAGLFEPGGIGGIAHTVAGNTKEFIAKIIKLDTNPITSFNVFGFFTSTGQFFFDSKNSSIANWLVDTISSIGALSFGSKIATMSKGGIGPFTGDASFITGVASGLASFVALQTVLRQIIPYLILYLIIIIALLWALFRLWFQLIMAYIFILIDVVLAPFWIVAGLFPGNPIGFGAWLRDIVANLSAFPVTIAMFLLGNVFMQAFTTNPQKVFTPPLVGNALNAEMFGALIGLGIILMTPQVVNMMKEALKAPQFKYGAAVGQAIGVGPAVAGGLTTAVVSPFGSLAMFRNMRKMLAEGKGPGGLFGLIGVEKVKPGEETKSSEHR